MASSYSAQGGEAERGVGGKLRRQPPPARRPTPYARPQQSQSHGNRWYSKIVDPARRIIAGGANRIIPYIFSNSTANNALQAPEPLNNENNDGYNDDAHQTADGDQFTFSPNAGATRYNDVANNTEIVEASKTVSGFEDYGQANKSNLTDTDGLSDIEQLMKDKIFSRDEINHLLEIINSRAVGASKVNQESKESSRFTEGAYTVSHQYPRKSAEAKQEDLSKPLRGLSTPLHLSTRKDEVGASPIDIAKAFMENRTSEASFGSRNLVSDDGRHPLCSADFALKPYLSPSSSKPAVVEDQHGYITPQRSRFGLRSLPRTPYTRPIFSESKSKLTPRQADADGSLYNSRTPLQQSRTPIFRQSRAKAADFGHGSVGPIRRVRLNHGVAAETSSRSAYSRSLANGPQFESSSVSKSIFSATKKNLEPGETSRSSLLWSVDGKSRDSEVGTSTVHPHSSQVARTILEHLERKVPSPKDKSDELKLATSWRKSNSSDASAILPKERHSLSYFGGFDSKNKDQLDAKASEQRNGDRGNSTPLSLPESTIGTKDAVNKKSSDLSEVDGASVKLFTGKSESSLDFQKTEDSQNRSVLKEVSTIVANTVHSPSLQKPPSNSTGNKRGLPPISIGKPVQSWTFSTDNSSGFSFPVSTASGVSSEPPTPSIMPSVSTSAQPQSDKEEDPAVPSFSFGSEKSTPLVFSFPSSSSGPNHVESSDIKFSFGSDKSTRISFSSVGKDAICY